MKFRLVRRIPSQWLVNVQPRCKGRPVTSCLALQDQRKDHGRRKNIPEPTSPVRQKLERFRAWLEEKNNLASYLERLASNFNPCAVASLTCKILVSVSWDGYLYDCDFNLAREALNAYSAMNRKCQSPNLLQDGKEFLCNQKPQVK